MKKTINTLLAVAVVAVAMISCGGTKTKDMLAKKWQLSEFKSADFDKQMADMKMMADTTKDSAMKAMYAMNLENFPKMMDAMKASTFEYKADGNFEASIAGMSEQPMAVKGTWKLSEDSKKLITTDDKQKTDSMNIESVDAEKLVVSTNMGGTGSAATITFVPAK